MQPIALYITKNVLSRDMLKSNRLSTVQVLIAVLLLRGTEMTKLIPAAERVVRARQLIQQAREFPVPPELGKNDLSYIAGVKDLLRQARDMVKFIPQTAGVSAEMKETVRKIYEEADQANREILY
jgi:hypothetical protein